MSGGVKAAPRARPMVCRPCTNAQSARRKPHLEHPGGHGKYGRLRAAQQQLQQQQRGEQAGPAHPVRRQRRRDGRQKCGNSDDHEGAPRALTLPENTAGKLEERVAQDEAPFDQADLKMAEPQFRHHGFGRYRDALLLQISQKAEPEQHGENTPADADRRDARGGLQHIFLLTLPGSVYAGWARCMSRQISTAWPRDDADLSAPGMLVDLDIRLQQHAGQQQTDDAGMRESPAHFLRRRLAAAPLLARVGADHIDDGNRVGGSRRRHGAQILERHMAGVYFLIAQDAHQQFRRQIVGRGSQAHAHHDRSRGHDRAVPATGR